MSPEVSVVDEIEATVRSALASEYRIEGLLGRGGMSVVFLARDVQLNRPVALKVLPLKFAEEKTAPERFRQEATIAASLDHPHITPVHRYGTTPEFLWYSMKYIRGQSLEETLRDLGRLGLHSCLSLVEQAASALEYAHRRGVVHRDMKPANVMLDENSWAYVCDFGVAKATGNVKLTQTGGTIGTPAYMSPEQLYGQSVDGRSDQYSLAVMTFELLAGRHPFVAHSVGEVVRMHCVEPAPHLSDIRPDLPGRVTEGVLKAMSKQPDERFDSVLDFLSSIGGRRPPRAPQPRASTEVSEAITEPIGQETRVIAPPLLPRRAGHLTIGMVAAAIVFATQALVGGRGAEGTVDPMAVTVPAQPAATADSSARPVAFGYGKLWLNSQPLGRLIIDGELIGNIPVIGISVGEGRHVLSIVQDGYRRWERAVDIEAGQEIRWTDIVLERER